jgi:hypothetical protein
MASANRHRSFMTVVYPGGLAALLRAVRAVDGKVLWAFRTSAFRAPTDQRKLLARPENIAERLPGRTG